MKIQKFLHSCLLVDNGKSRLLFDPGKFSFVEGLVSPEDFHAVLAVVLTHGHPDHVDHDALKKVLAVNPEAVVIANGQTAYKLAEAGLPAIVHEHGEREFADFSLKAIPAQHARILGLEPPQNTAYVVDDILLNPGDSFSTDLYPFAGVRGLVVPVLAPWGNELQMMDFVEAMKPTAVVPVHDGQAKAFFIAQRYETYAREFTKRNIRFADLQRVGEEFEL